MFFIDLADGKVLVFFLSSARIMQTVVCGHDEVERWLNHLEWLYPGQFSLG